MSDVISVLGVYGVCNNMEQIVLYMNFLKTFLPEN